MCTLNPEKTIFYGIYNKNFYENVLRSIKLVFAFDLLICWQFRLFILFWPSIWLMINQFFLFKSFIVITLSLLFPPFLSTFVYLVCHFLPNFCRLVHFHRLCFFRYPSACVCEWGEGGKQEGKEREREKKVLLLCSPHDWPKLTFGWDLVD